MRDVAVSFLCMKALKISMAVKNDTVKQMNFYWQGFFYLRHSSHRLWNACLYEARGLLIIPKSGLFDVMDHWHFPQGCPYIVHAFHGGQEKGSVIKVPTPMSRWWSGVWLSGADWMARWHFSMADPSEVSSLTGGSYHHASCVRPRIGSQLTQNPVSVKTGYIHVKMLMYTFYTQVLERIETVYLIS